MLMKKPPSADTGLWGRTTVLNQPMYFKEVLTLERKSENVLHQGRGYSFKINKEQI